MSRLAIAALLLCASASPSPADCAAWGLAPKVLTPANVVIPGDGGIVVAAAPDAHGKLDAGDPAVQASWRLRIAGELIKPPVELLAPGLAVYRVAVANAFKVELEDAGHAVVATVRPARGARDVLAAPKVKRVWFEATHGRRSVTRVGVELDGPPPAGAVALVLADAAGTPRSWAPVDAGTTLYPYATADCVALPNGTIASKAGEAIMLGWVDDAGRPSKPTAATIAK